MSLVALAQQQSLAIASRHHNQVQWQTNGQLNAGLAVGLSYALKRFMPADLVFDKDRVVSLFILIAAGASYVASGAKDAYFVKDAPSGQADASQVHHEVVIPAKETDCTLSSTSGPELVKFAGNPAGRRSVSVNAREGSSSGEASNSQGGRDSEQGNNGGHDRGVSGGAGGDQPPPNRQGDLRRSDRIARRRPTPAPGPALPVPHKPRQLVAIKEEESSPPPFDPPPPPPPPPQIDAPMENNGRGAGLGLALIIGAILAGVTLLVAIRRAKRVARKVGVKHGRKARGRGEITSLDVYKARTARKSGKRGAAALWQEKGPVNVYDPFAVTVFNRGFGRYPVCPNIEGQLSASLRTPENPYLVTEVMRPRVVLGTKLSCPFAAQLQAVREHPATVFLAKVYGWVRHCAGVLYAAFWAAPGARYIAQLFTGVGIGILFFVGTSGLVAWNERRMGREDNGWLASPFARAPLIPRMEQWDLREERRQEERRRRREERAAQRRAGKAPERNKHVQRAVVQAVAVAVDATQHEVVAEPAIAQVVAVAEDAVQHEVVSGSSREAVIVPAPASEGDDDGQEEFHSAVTFLDLSVVEVVEAALVASTVTDAGVNGDVSAVEEEVKGEVEEEEEKREVVVAAASDIVQDHKSEVGKVQIEEEDKMDEWRKAVLALASWAPLPAIREKVPEAKAVAVAAERVVVLEEAVEETAAPATALAVAEVADAVEETAPEASGVVDDSDKNNVVAVQGSRRHRARPKKKAKKADTADSGEVKGEAAQDRVVLGDIKNRPATNANGKGRAVKPAVVVARQRRRAQLAKSAKQASASGTA